MDSNVDLFCVYLNFFLYPTCSQTSNNKKRHFLELSVLHALVSMALYMFVNTYGLDVLVSF